MSNLVAVGFDNEYQAFILRAELAKLQKEHLIEMDDIAVVTRDNEGKTNVHQATDLGAEKKKGGGLLGVLIGTIFLNPLLGAAVGAGFNAMTDKLSEFGMDEEFLNKAAETFKPGSSALVVLVRKSNVEEVLKALKGFGGKILKTTLDANQKKKLQDALEGL